MARTVQRKATLTKKQIPLVLTEYNKLRSMAEDFGAKADELKKQLSDAVDVLGLPDDKGSVWLEFDEPIDGVTALKREKRVSKNLDPDRTEKYLKKHKLWEDCTEEVRVIDTDSVMAAIYEERIPAEDAETLWVERITWAFKPERKK